MIKIKLKTKEELQQYCLDDDGDFWENKEAWVDWEISPFDLSVPLCCAQKYDVARGYMNLLEHDLIRIGPGVMWACDDDFVAEHPTIFYIGLISF